MRLSAFITISLVTLAACGSQSPQAPGVGSAILEKLGLPGRWAQDCFRPYNTHNPHLIYTAPTNGVPTEQVLMDPNFDRTTELLDVKELPGGSVQWTQKAGDTMVTVVTKLEGNRQKTWSSTVDDGTQLISNGKFSGGGEPPWFSKCETN